MSDNINQTIGSSERKQETKIDLRPTLFIGIGGTGMQVLMRVRRRILNTLWGNAGNRTRVDSLADFPIAQFIHFDLDSGAVVESGRAQADDTQFDLVKFTDEEKIVESFDMEKYSRDDDALEKYPHIKEWLPLNPKKIRELGIDPGKGAGQMRAVSRLYFFDKYPKIRDKVRQKLRLLKSGLSHDRQLAELGLRMANDRFRVVVVGSVAGGTGSGAFLDMGLLARWLTATEVNKADVELMLFLPSGYSGANKDRTEANGYAALMELEAAMKGNQGYVGRWDTFDNPVLPREPYNDVYLIDTGNLAQQNTKDIADIYNMVSDALFEDFASGDFAREKRSTAVNQAQHKNFPHDAPVPKNRFADMRLSYSKRFSAFGQAVLDTHQEARRDEQAHRWAGEMLKAFFGVGGSDLGANRATDKQRDEFIATHMGLKVTPFVEFPNFSDKNIELKRSNGEFHDYLIVEDLLKDRHGALLAGVEQRVNQRIDEIRNSFERRDWPNHVRDAVRQLERDAVRDQDSAADVTEDRVAKRRREELERIKGAVRNQLYAYLDNKEYGGLEYVLSLVEQIKDRLEAPVSGLIAALGTNADRYSEIKEAVRTREYERLLNNLEQAKGGFFSNGEKQATIVMDHLRIEIANGVKFHLRATAAQEAARLMGELSQWLGRKTGVDAHGRPLWNGLVGELQDGREAVLDMLNQLHQENAVLRDDLAKDYVTLINVPVSDHVVPMPGANQLREWADDAFKDIGGSKVLFPMLVEPDRRGEILSKVKRMAERQLLISAARDGNEEANDPLFTALEQMASAERQEYFRKLLACAMPWIDANMAGDFSPNADQFKCFIGVANSEEFKRVFGAELAKAIPTQAGLTPVQMSIVETGQPGRAVCYVELSGVPMTVLRGMDGWRTSYRKEAEKSPTHTHIDSTQFSHPLAPSTDELNRLAEDFKQFLLAIMLGVVTRVAQRVVPAGQYQFAVAKGDARRIGNERAVRQNGLPPTYREAIIGRVQDRINELSALQTGTLAYLCQYYENKVYTPKLIANASGIQEPRVGFASAIAAEAKRELFERARRKGLADSERAALQDILLDNVRAWASVIPESDADAYDWEVREADEDGALRLKYAVQPSILEPGALETLVAVHTAAAPAAAPVSSPFAQPASAPAMAPAMMPSAIPPALPGLMPPPLVEHQYHLGVNGQTFGPYTSLQIAQMLQASHIGVAGTKVWRQGLAGWIELNQCAELAAAIAPPAAAVPPPLV